MKEIWDGIEGFLKEHVPTVMATLNLKKSVENGIIPRSPQPAGYTDDLVAQIRSPRG